MSEQHFKFANLPNISMNYVFLILLLDILIKHDFVVPPLTVQNKLRLLAPARFKFNALNLLI